MKLTLGLQFLSGETLIEKNKYEELNAIGQRDLPTTVATLRHWLESYS